MKKEHNVKDFKYVVCVTWGDRNIQGAECFVKDSCPQGKKGTFIKIVEVQKKMFSGSYLIVIGFNDTMDYENWVKQGWGFHDLSDIKRWYGEETYEAIRRY